MIEISLISEGVVYAYSQGLESKAHGNKFDECKGLPSVLFVRTVQHGPLRTLVNLYIVHERVMGEPS